MCRDPENQFRFEVLDDQCHAAYALAAAQQQTQRNGASPESVAAAAWSARLKPRTT